MARRLLLVEDSSTMRRMISSLLKEEGYDVSLAVDGNDGLEKARSLRPEMIITDYEMPEMDGASLCQALKADPELRPIPVLMLTTLSETASKVAGLNAGADDYMEKPKAPGEIQEVFARVRAQLRIADLMTELAERNRQLEAAQAKLELELQVARRVQMGLMPKPPKPRGVVMFGVSYQPANALGGDVYDFAAFTTLKGERIGILVADISGHGVNSALLSGMVKTLAAPLTMAGLTPPQVLSGLDKAIEQFFPEGYFCTGFYLVLDEKTGSFDYAGVGHPPAIIVGPSGVRALDSDMGLLGVGMCDDLVGGTDQLRPGESILIYTDGLPDAMNPSDAMFGTDRINAVLQAHFREEPSAIIERITQAIAEHVYPNQPHDDINLVLVQYPDVAGG